MRVRKILAAGVFSATLAVAACSSGGDSTGTPSSSSAPASTDVSGALTAAQVLAANKADHTEDQDTAYDESKVVDVKLTGGSATASGDGVRVDGSTVTITAAGTYRLNGTLTGQVVVKAAGTVKLILDGADISSSSTAAIAATEAEKLVVILADGSQNTLSDAGSYADDADVNAALFSKADLTIAGDGALTVRGNGNDAIASTDGLVVESEALTVQAADDGIRGKDYLVVDGGTVAVTAGGDSLKADNAEESDAGYISIAGGTVTLNAKGDGADAATDLVVTGGALTVTAGGGSGVAPTDEASTKALKSGVITVLEGGTMKLDSSDDAVHSDAAVHLAGAKVTAATGDDGVHAEKSLVIDAGSVAVTSSVEGLESAAIAVKGGDVSIVSSDDGVNAAGGTGGGGGGPGGGGPGGGGPGGGGEAVGDYTATVTGGTLVIDAGGDGFDSNGTATISGGTIVVNGPTMNGNGALDVNGTFQISGGVLLAAGSAGMAVAPDADSAQGWLSATFDSTITAGATVQVVDSGGKLVATFVTSKDIQNLVYSSAAVAKGAQYKIYVGGKATGGTTGGLAKSGSLGSATVLATVTAGEAPAGNGFGPGGGRPGR
jgi:hypothetical protein